MKEKYSKQELDNLGFSEIKFDRADSFEQRMDMEELGERKQPDVDFSGQELEEQRLAKPKSTKHVSQSNGGHNDGSKQPPKIADASPLTARRLNEVAVEFNISKETIIEHLSDAGFEIKPGQNFRLSENMYKELQQEFTQYKVENVREITATNDFDTRKKLEQKRKIEQQRINREKQEMKMNKTAPPLFGEDEVVHF